MPKSIKKLMPFKIDFWSDFGDQNRSHNRAYLKSGRKRADTEKPMDFEWFLSIWGGKLATKIDQKSIKNWRQHRKASWHLFLIDFGGFWEASWEGKWSQDQSKKASKTRSKNGRHQDGRKIEIKRSYVARPRGSKAAGRDPSFHDEKTFPSLQMRFGLDWKRWLRDLLRQFFC